MMNRYRSLLVMCLLVGILGFASTALAQEETPFESVLTLDPMEAQVVGSRPTVTARLLDREGEGNPNKVLILYLDGERVRRIRTDESGVAEIRISRDLPVGTYHVLVEFIGTEAYLPASASMTLVIRPIQLTLETVPPLPNITFSFEGQTFVSDAKGLVQLEIDEPGTYQLNALDTSNVQVNEDTRATFSRWEDSVFQPERTLEASGDMWLQAGFSTSHPIGLSFVDLTGKEVDAARVSSVVLKRSDGSYRTFANSQPRWLMASRIVRRKEGLEAAPLLYSVESVMVDGTSAVNRYQQRFYVGPEEDTWTIELRFYSARIHATDAIFGFRIGRGVALQYPDGRIEEFQFGESDDVYITSLARGLYHVQIMGVHGMAPRTPIALSKDQDVELKVLTALDIGAGVVSGLVVALALLLYKRPHLLTLVFGWLPRVGKRVPRPIVAHTSTREMVAEQIPDSAEPVVSSSTYPVVNVEAIPTNGDRSIAWLVENLHPEGFGCPECGHTQAEIVRTNQRSGLKIYRCCVCHTNYSLYTGTPFEGSRLTPEQSERLMREVSLNHAQLAEELGLARQTVRKWQQRLQAAGALPDRESSVEHEGALLDSVDKDR